MAVGAAALGALAVIAQMLGYNLIQDLGNSSMSVNNLLEEIDRRVSNLSANQYQQFLQKVSNIPVNTGMSASALKALRNIKATANDQLKYLNSMTAKLQNSVDEQRKIVQNESTGFMKNVRNWAQKLVGYKGKFEKAKDELKKRSTDLEYFLDPSKLESDYELKVNGIDDNALISDSDKQKFKDQIKKDFEAEKSKYKYYDERKDNVNMSAVENSVNKGDN